jgi:hypothetical protein
MKRKVKRYSPGGGIEDDAISLEQTGGFGRAAAEEAAKRPTFASTMGQIDDRDRREMAMADMAKTKPAKSAVVTKEQMKKAGFDNLRDYLNAQRGLTRRGSAAAPAPKSMGPSGQDIDRMESALTASNIRDERRAYEQGKDATAAAKKAADMQKERAAYLKEQNRLKEDTQTGSGRLARKAEAFRTRMREQAAGMKKGGMVASKRADGIAQRGKTRGRII